MFGFKMPGGMKFGGGGPSPMSRMNNQQRLQALGAAFSGDQDQLQSVMASLGSGDGAVPPGNSLTSQGREPPSIEEIMGDVLPKLAGRFGRRFGFGGK